MPDDRAKSHETEAENLRPGRPPRPATEPAGAEQASTKGKTKTDPATGAPAR